MNYKKAFTLSIIIHCLFLYHTMHAIPLGMGGNGAKGDSQQQNQGDKGGGGTQDKGTHTGDDGSKEHIVEKPVEVSIVEVPKPKETGGVGAVKHKGDKCKKFFGGIGVEGAGSKAGDFMIVSKIWPGYPAADTDLQPGDRILNLHTLRGKIGQTITFNVLRDGIRFDITTVRDKICIEEDEP